MPPSIRTVFFDFGGVVARLDGEEIGRLEDKYGLPDGGLLDALYEIPEWKAVRLGRISEKDWLQAVGRHLDELAGRPIPGIRRDWPRVWRGLDQDVVGLLKRLRGRYRVGLISNARESLDDELANHHGISDLFDVVVNSARVGLAKPDPRIYLLAAERARSQPSHCLHIDDLIRNVWGAREAGFQAIHYEDDYPSLERELRSLGVQW
ncbi:MAG: HAD family hydrolase [Dehalococcoidia bacterium]